MTSPQQPLPSGFNARSTVADVLAGLDLAGKTAIVTGGYSGIGLVAAKALAAAGARVVVPARDRAKAEKNIAGAPGIEIASLDLTDPASIDAFAVRFLEAGAPLDMLINCAGIMAPPLMRDGRGYEIQFSTNHLGHFQLTARLWPALLKTGGARVVSVSSRGHHFAPVDLDDPNFERTPYDNWAGYGRSKTANVLFALELDRRGEAHGVRAFSVHPGGIMTDLARHLGEDELKRIGVLDENGEISPEVSAELKTPEQGAATMVWCATSPQLQGFGGVYCEDVDVAVPAREDGAGAINASDRTGVKAWARDPETAGKLWVLSERLTGVSFAI